MQRATADKSRIIRLPVHLVEQVHRIRKNVRRQMSKSGRFDLQELATEFETSTEKIVQIMQWDQTVLSLDILRLDEEATKHEPFEFSEIDPQENLNLAILQQSLERALYKLTEREATVLRLRNGFDGKIEMLDAIGKMFGVTRERIRQVENKSLRKLKYHESRTRQLREFLDLDD
jgi:RNA polymerase primary sigma factor